MATTPRRRAELWAQLAGRIVRMRSDLVVVALDIALAVAAFAAMLMLRYDASIPDDDWSGFATFIPLAALTIVVSNLAWGLYGQLWRHASLYEAVQLVKSGTSVMLVLLILEMGPRHVPISVVVTGTVVATFLMGLLRFQSRLFSFRRGADQPGLGVVVIGAGDAGCGARVRHAPQPAGRLPPGRRARRRPQSARPIVQGRPGGRATSPTFPRWSSTPAPISRCSP